MRKFKWMISALIATLVLGFVGVARLPVAHSCDVTSFLNASVVGACPDGEMEVSDGSFMQFENGFMIWSGGQDAIYVLYISEGEPRWQRFDDDFTEEIPDIDDDLNDLAPPYTFQPRRGMGLIWRENEDVQARLGWAVAEYEFPYQVEIWSFDDGTMYLGDWRGGVFVLDAEGLDWQRLDPL